MRRVVAALALLLIPFAAFAAGGLDFLIHLQDTTATITARWFYTPNPSYETWYDYVVVDEAASDTIIADSTSLTEITFTLQRRDVDKAYRFGVRPVIKDALGSIARSQTWVDDRFIIPALPAAGLLAKRDMVTSPVIIPNDPAFEQPRGTLWLEFETRNDITTTQGLWSRDALGYQGGGHLAVFVRNGSVVARIQSDSTSYELQWPIVANAINQAAVEFGPDTGFRLHVNGAFAMSNPYTGGTVGNSRDIVVGALNWDWAAGRPDYTNPFSGTVRVSEFYMGRYDFSGRWGLPPLPEPPPVDSLSVEVAQIDRGAMSNGTSDYFVIRFTPIPESATLVTYVNGALQGERPALLPVAVGDWEVLCSGACQADASWRGWQLYNRRTGARCNVLYSGWTIDGTGPPCGPTRAQLLAMQQRNDDCVGGRYWAKHSAEIECNFNILIAQSASWNYARGTNPVLRLEVLDRQRQRIGFWERMAS
ncbi:MAG: hypothetical protein AMJ65_15545 [Phycisphaerae bacterium SG8_4]|nr:MAG: hypothetical protein AMJ65_15545 [Phycisphaerae bacterium SG8_4]